MKEPLTFTVHQQQRKADLANLKLTQYLVRLKFDDVNKPKRVRSERPKHSKKVVDKDGSDFDSEKEYGDEGGQSDSQEYEMDDGKKSESDDDAEEAEEAEDEVEEMSEPVEKAYEGKVNIDKYQMDPFLVRREATLLCLVRRGFHQRVIVFFNEKKQCQRAHILFSVFGLKSAEIHGNMTQSERMDAIEKF